jgi:hypothetical protein
MGYILLTAVGKFQRVDRRPVIFEESLAKPKPSAGEALLAAGEWNVRDRRNKGASDNAASMRWKESVHHVRSTRQREKSEATNIHAVQFQRSGGNSP